MTFKEFIDQNSNQPAPADDDPGSKLNRQRSIQVEQHARNLINIALEGRKQVIYMAATAVKQAWNDVPDELKEEVKAHLLFLKQHSTGHATQPNAAYVLRVLGYPPDDDSMGTPVFSY